MLRRRERRDARGKGVRHDLALAGVLGPVTGVEEAADLGGDKGVVEVGLAGPGSVGVDDGERGGVWSEGREGTCVSARLASGSLERTVTHR